jgi:energy-converting hydrogenase A subunit M
MKFYWLEIVEFDDFVYRVPDSLTTSEAFIDDLYSRHRKDIYKRIEIKDTELSIEDVVEILIRKSRLSSLGVATALIKGIAEKLGIA